MYYNSRIFCIFAPSNLKIKGMSNSKLVSFRCDEDLLRQVDVIVSDNRYYNRSSVIEAGLKVMVELARVGKAGRALSFHPKYDEVMSVDFQVRRKVTV